jgi:hypothetical protein
MKRNWLRVLALILLSIAMLTPSAPLVAQQPSLVRSEQPKEQTVYVTRTGKKYHRDGCRHLVRSRLPITLREAKQHKYTPCRVCKPPR